MQVQGMHLSVVRAALKIIIHWGLLLRLRMLFVHCNLEHETPCSYQLRSSPALCFPAASHFPPG